MAVKDTAADIIRFTNNTAGIEKILKGLVGILLLPQSPSGKSLTALSPRAQSKFKVATQHISAARKVLRVLYFLDTALRALEARKGPKNGNRLLKWLIIAKWTLTSIFAATDTATILFALEVFKVEKSRWANRLTRVGNKIYFVAICCSIAAACIELWELHREKVLRKQEREKQRMMEPYRGAYASASDSDTDSSESVRRRGAAAGTRVHHNHNGSVGRMPGEFVEHQNGHAQSNGNGNSRISALAVAEAQTVGVDAARIKGTTNAKAPNPNTVVAHLLADICDLTIPASRIGLFKNDEAVGLAHIFHSLLAGSVIWGRVNAKALPTKDANSTSKKFK